MKKLFVECLFKKEIQFVADTILLQHEYNWRKNLVFLIVYKKRLLQISDTSQSSIERIIRSSYFSSSFLEK